MKGSCCCGAIAFELSEPPGMMATCHCSRCRKLGVSTFVFVRRDAFVLLRGTEAIATYPAVSPYRYDRRFCRHCGSGLGEIGSDQESFPINAHLLDGQIAATNRFHEFVAEKPHWSVIGDDAPQFAEHPRKSG